MAALELVADRAKTTSADKKTMAVVSERAYEAGLMIRISGSNIIMSPPLIITASDVETIVTAFDHALDIRGQ